MNIDNYIESQYREIENEINEEFIDLYKDFKSKKLKEIFSTIHYICVENYKLMNQRLPTKDTENHFWAEPSRKLNRAISIVVDMEKILKTSEHAFYIDEYYKDIFNQSMQFFVKYRR